MAKVSGNEEMSYGIRTTHRRPTTKHVVHIPTEDDRDLFDHPIRPPGADANSDDGSPSSGADATPTTVLVWY